MYFTPSLTPRAYRRKFGAMLRARLAAGFLALQMVLSLPKVTAGKVAVLVPLQLSLLGETF
jgi:hypothetical protein